VQKPARRRASPYNTLSERAPRTIRILPAYPFPWRSVLAEWCCQSSELTPERLVDEECATDKLTAVALIVTHTVRDTSTQEPHEARLHLDCRNRLAKYLDLVESDTLVIFVIGSRFGGSHRLACTDETGFWPWRVRLLTTWMLADRTYRGYTVGPPPGYTRCAERFANVKVELSFVSTTVVASGCRRQRHCSRGVNRRRR
jgi:hypothetical protein